MSKILKRSTLEKEYKFLLHLRVVRLNLRKIKFLEDGLFKNLNKLEVINLSRNEIDAIKQHFIGLRNLKELQLSYNKISGCLTDQMLNGLLNLTKIDLSYNLINKLNDKIFNGLVNLKSIDLSHNQIETIDLAAFKNLSDLEELNLDMNKLCEFQAAAAAEVLYQHLKNLKILNLSNQTNLV